jgi:hypothetical protein
MKRPRAVGHVRPHPAIRLYVRRAVAICRSRTRVTTVLGAGTIELQLFYPGGLRLRRELLSERG